MKNNFLLLVFIMFCTRAQVFAQAICGFDDIHHTRMQTDADYRQRVEKGEKAILQYIRQHPTLGQPRPIQVDNAGAPIRPSIPNAPAAPLTGGPPYTIPVVVHIVHTGGAIGSIYNPTDAQIQGAIDYLNAVYNGTYPTLAGGIGNLEIQFALAKRDPNCNPTTGINRVDGSSITNYVSGGVRTNSGQPGTDDINVKNLIRWDPAQYYNVWVVDKINGADGTTGQFTAGFAYFPGAPASLDGIVMLATQMITGQKTLPHEIGHAFNLYHPFEGSTDKNTCPSNPNNSCSLDGDKVCDTDPISENITGGVIDFTCRSTSTVNPCATPAGTNYSINTESNYMNYTSCYTLFTAGQKARMLASAAGPGRASLTTSMGGTPPNAGVTPCVPKVNFAISSDQATESTISSSGCRSYKDYTYNMIIGNTPSAATSVTLTFDAASTATLGLDYDITTNGNFSSPSLTLTFPPNDMTPKTFTIRVYDDASINGTRTVMLGFSVNNGGGNAVAGDGIPKFTFSIRDNDKAPTPGTSTGIVNLGSSVSGITQTPFDASARSQRSQFLYKASELTGAGLGAGPITGLTVQVAAKHSVRAYTNLNIKIGTASVNYLVDGAVTAGAGMTVVKSAASYSTVSGSNTFAFDSPYNWDGVSNLVVEFCYDNGSAASSDAGDQVAYYSDGGTADQGSMFWQNDILCSQSFSTVNAYGNGLKPRISFQFGIPATVVQTVANTSGSEYLGPNADIYFYDQANGRLMARIKNMSTFDYGCTQVLIDRQGTGAAQFWNNTAANYLMDKTFRVLPTTNNTSGSYSITLYYTLAEVTGWQNATGQNVNNIQLVKVGTKISDVSPGNSSGAGAVVIGSPVIGTLGTNTTLTYTFTNGFSGFGAGIPAVPLPINLLSFDGRLHLQNVDLAWITASEQNSKSFDIERSYDGISYMVIGKVPALGNSSNPHTYTFTDTSIAREKNYYRLKQLDLDNQATYSKIVQVNSHVAGRNFTVSPSPFTTTLDIVLSRAPQGRTRVRLMDIAGKTLLRQDNTPAGQHIIHMEVSRLSLPAGLYLLEVTDGASTWIEKVYHQ